VAAVAPAAGPPAPDWPAGWPPPPAGLELIGIERAPKRVAAARRALGTAAEVREGDLAEAEPPPCDAALLLDLLHYLRPAEQQALLDRTARALAPGGVLLVREADAARGARFALTRAAERLAALVRGHWRQSFHYRSAAGWERLLAERGFAVSASSMWRGTPFANVLLVARSPGTTDGPGDPTRG
jgi:trans-aconitate methyltransferase